MFARPRRTASELHARRSIESSIGSGVPPDAVAFAARWWQLETWLRELLYLELRAKHGRAWEKVVEGRNQKRAELDADNRYMPSPDAEDLLAYTDTGALLKLIGTPETWELVEPSLLPRVRWDGLVDALRDLRNRNAHLRRPHVDDLGRLEQALRDLEPGARRALLAFNQQRRWWKADGDPLGVAWLERGHEDAKRLIDHARRQYGTDFTLSSSARPWVAADQPGPISGRPGYFWHAEWTLHDGRFLSPRDFWHCFSSTGITRGISSSTLSSSTTDTSQSRLPPSMSQTLLRTRSVRALTQSSLPATDMYQIVAETLGPGSREVWTRASRSIRHWQ